MAGKKMEGSEEQRRAAAREARREGKSPSEMGASTGASQQHRKASGGETHQERLDLKRQGKQDLLEDEGRGPEARPGSRDPDTADQERRPGRS
jgi:hypothetical protein